MRYIIILLVVMVLSGCSTNKETKFDGMSTEELYSLWEEVPFNTEVNLTAYMELEKRGYWEIEDIKREAEAIEILNKYFKK